MEKKTCSKPPTSQSWFIESFNAFEAMNHSDGSHQPYGGWLRNPAPPNGWCKPKLNNGMFTTYQLMQEFFHPQYHSQCIISSCPKIIQLPTSFQTKIIHSFPKNPEFQGSFSSLGSSNVETSFEAFGKTSFPRIEGFILKKSTYANPFK